ncbi:cytochrome c [Oceanisphaera avium]|uniref:Cytochrome c domain-containing protein n=1 Tax=Oceanisphaera avium TaxID=1903694 RepID=A0A1Y0CXH1_9GAMM|nr:cytochrome c [Oceanisphaera avium]ART80033.1 hypothetical protein CBP12_07635 [Oceanisphaera avium]
MHHPVFLAAGLALTWGLSAPLFAAEQLDSSQSASLVEQGQYIAKAADCLACHVGPDGTPYAGGKPTATPMGDIIAPNISSSKKYGIGDYSVKDLTRVLRDGKTPSGRHLYPAMPYPAYRGMTDEDIKSLHAYLKTTAAVEQKPSAKTDLKFPFSMRWLMIGWNAKNLDNYQAPQGLDDQAARGQYLVDHLGHCGTCHTPRNSMMGSDYDQYLGGAQLGNWFAPNITSDQKSGIGAWSEQQLADYFKTGQMGYAAQAAGPMAEAVHYSLQYLNEEDRLAIAAYLKSVPAIADDAQQQPVLDTRINETLLHREPKVTQVTRYEERELAQQGLKQEDISDPDSANGLYAQYCASCHGDEGYGQTTSFYASLVGNTTVRSANPRNLVAVILKGVEFRGATPKPLMPGFEDKLNHQQIATLANYVRTEFGAYSNSEISTDDVAYIASGKQKVSALIRYAPLLAWLGIILVAVIIIAGVWYWRRRRPVRVNPTVSQTNLDQPPHNRSDL